MTRRRLLPPPWCIAAVLLLATVGCDVPTEPPTWEQTWILPADPLQVDVDEVLPPEVVVTDDGAAFSASLEPIDLSVSLAELCEPCRQADGATVPKPPFTETIIAGTVLPEGLVSARLVGGDLDLRLSHGLSFDPLRPAGAGGERGHMVVELTSDGAVVARDSVSGADVAFPAGAVLEPDLSIRETDVVRDLEVRVTISSPAGGPVDIDASESFEVRLPAGTILISEAVIEAEDVAVDGDTTELDVEGMDEDLVERIRRGGLRMDVEDPFGVAGELTFDFLVPGAPIRKTVALTPDGTPADVEFTGGELRRILQVGIVDVAMGGSLSAVGGTITVIPGQALVLDTDLEVVILIGGSAEDA